MERNIRLNIILVVATAISMLLSFAVVSAQQFSSSNYSINEAFIGTGGLNETSSTSYWARATLGETAIGEVDSTLYKAFGGFETTDQEFIELNVNATIIDMGNLDEITTGTGTATFSVRTYLAEGYSVTQSGGPPTNESGDTIDALSSGGTSTQGVNQFGINLVANTAPVAQGANPDNPFTFSYGQADGNYNTDGTYRYNTGEQIAFSNSSSGITNYTISYIMNVEENIPAGLYSMDHSIIATSTF